MEIGCRLNLDFWRKNCATTSNIQIIMARFQMIIFAKMAQFQMIIFLPWLVKEVAQF